MTNTEWIIIALFAFFFFIYAIVTLDEIFRLSNLLSLVSSEKTEHFKDFQSKMNSMMEVFAKICGSTLYSPITNTPCLMYSIDILVAYDKTRVSRTACPNVYSGNAIEEGCSRDTYLTQNGHIVPIDLTKQEKVRMHSFEWHLLDHSHKHIVEEYLNKPHIQKIIYERGLNGTDVFGFRESLIPVNKPIYVLGKVSPEEEKEWKTIEGSTAKNLPYTLIGHVYAISEDHYIHHLKNKRLIQICFFACLIIIPTAITLCYIKS